MHALLHRLVAGVALALAALSYDPAHAIPYGGLVVFGDSLSDGGNNGALGLYAPNQVVTGNGYVATFSYAPDRTYSNGPVWVDYLADAMAVAAAPSLSGGTNYASGGAKLAAPGVLFGYPFSLRTQATRFLSANGGVAPPEHLYVIAGGGNDARDALTQIVSQPLDTVAGFNEAVRIFEAAGLSMVQNITAIVDQLQAAGAQYIVVWNLPNLGLAPSIPGSVRWIAELVTAAWSQDIAAALSSEPVALFDLFGISTYVAANLADFGFANGSDVCGAALAGTDCGTYLWWDGIHPTTRVHALLAEQMAALAGVTAPVLAAARAFVPEGIEDVTEPGTIAVLSLGLGLIAVVRTRSSRGRLRATAVGS